MTEQLFLGSSIEFGPGLVAVLTMLATTMVQITIAVLAYLTARRGTQIAVQADKKADAAAITNNLTHEIVNSQRTEMLSVIDQRDKKIAEQERAFHEKIRDLEQQMAKLNETVAIERSRLTPPGQTPEAHTP